MAEAAFIFGVKQDVTIEAVRPSSCLVLQKSDFAATVRDFPEASERIKTNVKSQLRLFEKWDVLRAIEKANGKAIRDVTPC